MAYDVNKLAKLGALKQMGERIAADYATKTEVADAINTKVSSAYTAGGSVTFDELPELTEANVGLVVNVTDGFTTTDSFIEGAGAKYPAGTNVVVVKSGEEYKYDALSGFVDLSGYVEKVNGKGLSTNDFTDAHKEKLDGIEEAVSNAITNATTMVDNTVASRYGLDLADGSRKISFALPTKTQTITVTPTMTMQDIVTRISSQSGGNFKVTYDEAAGLVFAAADDEPMEVAVTDYTTGAELTFTPGERVGPMYSFNGRSGMVVPQAGDYTPEMVGVTIATDDEVTEMLAEVFGAAE